MTVIFQCVWNFSRITTRLGIEKCIYNVTNKTVQKENFEIKVDKFPNSIFLH